MEESIQPSILVVVTPLDPAQIATMETDGEQGGDDATTTTTTTTGIVSPAELAKDRMDVYNHPRERRALIVKELEKRKQKQEQDDNGGSTSYNFALIEWKVVDGTTKNENQLKDDDDWRRLYETVHTPELLDFLTTAWSRFDSLGTEGQTPGYFVETGGQQQHERVLVPGNTPLHRDVLTQRPSKNVMGQMGYFCTDVDTPVFADLCNELYRDGSLIQTAVQEARADRTIYTLVTHPGHHAAADSFGGFCYVNHVAAMAKLFTADDGNSKRMEKVAILDVDYHVGNGTASIFYSDPSVLVVSIHCDPDFEYPFHSGFADQTGDGDGVGTTLFLPLPPSTDWDTYSKRGLQPALEAIADFGAEALIVSLGLDTHRNDPVTLRRAGFSLQGNDYVEMGRQMGKAITPLNIPTIFLQEGGYLMNHVAEAAADVVTSFCQTQSELPHKS